MWMLLNEFPGFHNPLDLPVSVNLILYGREVSLYVRVSGKTPYYSRPPFRFGALQATLRLVAQLVQRPSHCVTKGSIDERGGSRDPRKRTRFCPTYRGLSSRPKDDRQREQLPSVPLPNPQGASTRDTC